MFLTLLVLMITAFMLVDTQRIKLFLFSLVPMEDRTNFDMFLNKLNNRLSGVVRGQLLICLINAILTLVGLIILKVKFAFILATMAGIFSLIPIFGSVISTIPIFFISLTISPITALSAMVWIVGIHALEANLLNPKIMGDAAKIHPVLIVLALITGKHFYGIIGALLAVPIFSILITIFSFILEKAKVQEEGVANKGENDRIS
jgi:predicted PurR-regulated permease PerM